MQLKLEINGEESIHSFPDKKRVVIGRAPTSDIQVMAEGISRQHLEVHEKLEGEFYAIDKGSTHGTFINDEQLDKDKPVPFNSFFPIRLGTNVFIYLMDEVVESENESHFENDLEEDEEVHNETKKFRIEPELTETSKKKPLIHVPTTAGQVTDEMEKVLKKNSNLIEPPTKINKTGSKKIRKSTRTSDNKTKKSNKSSNNLPVFLAILIMVGAIGYYKWNKLQEEQFIMLQQKEAEDRRLAAELKKVEDELKRKEEEAKKKQALIEAQKDLSLYLTKDKCLVDIELSLCNQLKNMVQRSRYEGVIKELDKLFVLVDVKTVRDKIKNSEYQEEDLKQVLAEAKKVLGRIFHPIYFAEKLKYTLPVLEMNFENANLFALADFIYSVRGDFPENTKELKELTIIAIDDNKYLAHANYDINKLIKADYSKMLLYAQMLLRSNIPSKLKSVIPTIEYVAPKETTESSNTQ